MINIDSLPVPEVLQSLDYETLLAQKVERAKALVPNWYPLESDQFKIILEDLAYQELHLRTEWNELAKAFFLSTATGSDLEHYGVDYGVTRILGAKPYAVYTFRLSTPLNQDIVIPSGLVLEDATGKHTAIVYEDATLLQGNTSVDVTLELQELTSSSEAVTSIITTPYPFVIETTPTENFDNGGDREDDESLRYRILLSMADKSTAGSQESYESYTRKADGRIEDVNIVNGGAGIVSVWYYSASADALMQQRIEEALNAREVRPLSDTVNVAPAQEVSYFIEATLNLYPNQETAIVYDNAMASLKEGLEGLKTIGTTITLSEINDFLKVVGVKEVVITAPAQNITIAENQIGVNDEPNNNITFAVL